MWSLGVSEAARMSFAAIRQFSLGPTFGGWQEGGEWLHDDRALNDLDDPGVLWAVLLVGLPDMLERWSGITSRLRT